MKPETMSYSDVVTVLQATDCSEAHAVAQGWLDYLALRASGERLLTHAVTEYVRQGLVKGGR